MSRRRFTAGLVSVLLLALAVAVANAPPAHACSCEYLDESAAFARADAVFIGRVVDIDRPTSERGPAGTDVSTFSFEVDAVLKGDVSMPQAVVTESSGATCGLEATKGQLLVVHATRTGSSWVTPGPDQYYAGLCDGTRDLFGDVPWDISATSAPVQRPPSSDASSVATGSTTTPLRWVAGVVVLVAVAVAAGLGLSHRRRLSQ